MTKDQKKCIQLRDCFYAGYSMPQFCIDNGIKNPLIASYDSNFLWEVYVQFKYDKRIIPKLCLLSEETKDVNFSLYYVVGGCKFEPIDYRDIDKYDKYIILSTKKVENLCDEKTIYLGELLHKVCRYIYAERPLYNYVNKHKDVKVITANVPILSENSNNTSYEQEILKKNIFQLRKDLKNSKGKTLETRYDQFGYTNEEVLELLSLSGVKTNMDGTTELFDNDNELIKVHEGIRQTAYQNEEYENTIYLIGTCVFYGIGAPYDKTIESYLQKQLNDSGYRYRVVNQSQFYATRYQDLFYNLDKISVKKGDIVVVFVQHLLAENLPQFDTSKLFERPHEYGEVFADAGHLNERGYEVYAKELYKYLKNNNFMSNLQYENVPDNFSNIHMYGMVNYIGDNKKGNSILSQYAGEFDLYKKELSKVRIKIGSIVMNCNPFTLGHRYLVEYASKRVDHLYIFVVEEDKSLFPFKDRIELVKKGTADLGNVIVIPSGKFIISQLTFLGYFNKAHLQDKTIDSSMDVELFASEIAPQLGITIRFAGEEPLDKVTQQYNDAMSRILPQYGITFESIPRKEMNDEVISASRVRKLLDEDNYNEIKKLVPDTTFEYLQNMRELKAAKL